MRIDVDGLANARDLGGRLRADGSTTPSGVFIRTEALDRVTQRGWDELRNLGVTSIIDLRRPNERSGETPSDIMRFSVDLDGDSREFWEPYEADGRWGTPLYYGPHLAQMPDRMREVVEAIAAAPDGAVLFHCGAGWDRTGLVAATLFRAADVTASSATDDYLESFANAEAVAELHNRPSDVSARERILEQHGHTATSAFEHAYTDILLDDWERDAQLSDGARDTLHSWRGTLTDRRIHSPMIED